MVVKFCKTFHSLEDRKIRHNALDGWDMHARMFLGQVNADVEMEGFLGKHHRGCNSLIVGIGLPIKAWRMNVYQKFFDQGT